MYARVSMGCATAEEQFGLPSDFSPIIMFYNQTHCDRRKGVVSEVRVGRGCEYLETRGS
jgi:hypothetical protein